MNQCRNTVCLNMIVKNEAHVIERCLASVRALIDHWVIVDTGSTDGTQDIIRKYLADTPGTLYERPWVDFARNRTEALRYARGKADYLLLIDADEVAETDPDFTLPDDPLDSYDTRVVYGSICYLRKQFVRSELDWRYIGVLHEYITSDEAKSEGFLSGIRTLPSHDGARSQDPEKYRKDAEILERALSQDPDDSRHVFYLAQSYLNAGDRKKALEHYQRRSEMGGGDEEVWYSLYMVAQLQEEMNECWGDVLEAYLAAYQKNPLRLESLFHAGQHYLEAGDHHSAYLFFSRAMTTPPLPIHQALFVVLPIYEYLLPMQYAVACYQVGEYAAAARTLSTLLDSGKLPPDLHEQVVQDRRRCLDKLPRLQQAKNPTSAKNSVERLRIVVPFHEPGAALDLCLDSLLQQSFSDFDVVFLDNGSASDVASRLPLEDPRFTLRRLERRQVWGEALIEMIRSVTEPNDMVMVLPFDEALAAPEALASAMASLGDSDLLYGQHRFASGERGKARSATSQEDFEEAGSELVGRSTVLFRARLSHGFEPNIGEDESMRPAALTAHLLAAAGLEQARFLEADLTIVPAAVEELQSTSKEDSLTASLVPRPSMPHISCLMVTKDRLRLARQSIRCYANQTYQNRELVVLTDGTPRFQKALERYAEEIGAPRVRVVDAGERGQPLGRLRNLSMEAAGGQMVCQWDDDDFNHPNRLTEQSKYLFEKNAAACFFTDQLQLLAHRRSLSWIDWTYGGKIRGVDRLIPGTLMMRRDPRFGYPESGDLARRGEDSALLESLYREVTVASVAGKGYLYIYQFHGRNTFDRAHHERMSGFAVPRDLLVNHQQRILEALRYQPISRPVRVMGCDGHAFDVN